MCEARGTRKEEVSRMYCPTVDDHGRFYPAQDGLKASAAGGELKKEKTATM